MRSTLVVILVGAIVAFGPSMSASQETEATTEAAAPATPEPPAEPRPLDHSDYDRWNRLSGQTLSNDGNWVRYTLSPGDGDARLIIRSVHTTTQYEVLRGSSAQFTADSRYAIYLVRPDEDEVKKARKEKKKDEELPKSSLEILDLTNGEIKTIGRVRSFRLPEENGSVLAYLTEKDPPAPEPAAEKTEAEIAGAPAESNAEAAESTASAEEATGETKTASAEGGAEATETKEPEPETQEEPKPEEPAEEKEEGEEEDKEHKRDAPGTDLVLLRLPTFAEHRFEQVTQYQFDDAGTQVIYVRTPEDKREDGIWVLDTTTAKSKAIAQGLGKYQSLTLDEAGQQLAYLTNRHEPEVEPERWTIEVWQKGTDAGNVRVSHDSDGIPEGWEVATRSPSFSESGARLMFGTKPSPEREEKSEESEEENKEDEEDEDDEPEVKVDVWHWQDPLLQPMQLRQVSRERNRTYLAILTLGTDRIQQLATEQIPDVTIGNQGDADVALGTSSLPYRMQVSWDSPGYTDAYLIDLATGNHTQVLTGVQARPSLSPGAKFLYWFDRVEQHWFAMSTASKKAINLTELLPHPVHNELHDTPSRAGAYGSVGWSEDDLTLLVYDKYDIWATNPAGFWPPFCVTDGYGRKHETRFRYVRLDREERAIPAGQPLLLSAMDNRTKATGFYTDVLRSNEPPQQLVLMDEQLSTPSKAKDADVMLLTRSTFRNYPNLWVTDPEFRTFAQLSDANPQQADYTWGDAELYEWTALDGSPLQGILIKPDGFDPAKEYPMMVYFYERNSHRLHRYVTPAPGSSSVNWAFYVSRGYLFFVPDIPYRIGYPGRSAECAILSGVSSLVDEGYVDEDRIGVQGHSWGGYQVAHLVTQTDIFAAAEAGAPVSNMTSAYGGIRWGSGMSRMFQYEKTQSRIGATLWEALPKYLENSPLFHADKINTPLLILHNDEDGAVPWYQGIELFVAMRRLSKPCWMFNYNGEAHGLRQRHNQKDWTIRMQQFFDYYLMDAPPPSWLVNGIPAVEKGENLGLDLVEDPADR